MEFLISSEYELGQTYSQWLFHLIERGHLFTINMCGRAKSVFLDKKKLSDGGFSNGKLISSTTSVLGSIIFTTSVLLTGQWLLYARGGLA